MENSGFLLARLMTFFAQRKIMDLSSKLIRREIQIRREINMQRTFQMSSVV